MKLLNEITRPEITLSFESVPVITETRKLRAVWSPQLAQDLQAFQSIDTVAKLEQCMIDELAGSIDREIIRDILGGVNYLNEIAGGNPGGQWNDIRFPIVKRVHAQTIASDLVEVKPMSAPSGLLFYMDYETPGSKPKYIFLVPEKKEKKKKVWGIA